MLLFHPLNSGRSAEQSPGLQLYVGTFVGRSQSGVVAVELLIRLGLFAVVVVGGVGALVGAVHEDEDLSGQACLDDAVSPGRVG
jgi:Flp pilus assembly pilin Flp